VNVPYLQIGRGGDSGDSWGGEGLVGTERATTYGGAPEWDSMYVLCFMIDLSKLIFNLHRL
jgi:hypothetical protein